MSKRVFLYQPFRSWGWQLRAPDPPTPPTPPARTDPGSPDLAAQIARLVKKQGGSDKALELLLEENRGYRERHRLDGEELERLRKLAPAEGTLVLTADQKKLWDALVAAKITTPEQITTLTTENATLKEKVQNFEDSAVHAEAARELGWNANVLTRELGARGLVLEFKEVTVKDGDKTEKKKVPHVRPKDKKAGEGLEPLAEYADTNMKDYLPALRAGGTEGGDTGVPFVPQDGGLRKEGAPKTTAAAVKKVTDATFMTPGQRAAQANQK